MQSTSKTTLILIFFGILGYLSKYLFTVYLTHHLEPQLYGDFAIGMRVLGVVASLSLLGTDTSSRRFLPSFLEEREGSQAYDYIGWNLRLISTSFIICFLIALVSIIIMGTAHFSKIKDIGTYHFAVYMLWLAPVAGMISLLSSFLMCTKQHHLATLTTTIRFTLQLILFIVAVIYFDVVLNELNMTVLLFIAMLVMVLFEVFLLRIKSPDLFNRKIYKAWSKEKTYDKKWLSTSLNLISNNLVFFIISMVDLIIVQIMSPYKYDVAYYSVIVTISSLLYVITNNAYNHFKAKINMLLKTNSGKEELQILFNKTSGVVIILTIITLAFIILFSKTLLGHFGKVYTQATMPLIVAAIGSCIASLSRGPSFLLAYSGNEKKLLTSNAIELVLLICLLIPLTHFYGILGTAIGTLMASLYQTLAYAFLTRKTGVRTLLVI